VEAHDIRQDLSRIVDATCALWGALLQLPADEVTMQASLDLLGAQERAQYAEHLSLLAQKCGHIREYALQVKYELLASVQSSHDTSKGSA